jgi:hypothetical protein
MRRFLTASVIGAPSVTWSKDSGPGKLTRDEFVIADPK